ncbi:respiratory burst oxidase homolog protein F-like isoform X1 [Typha angustifolia]|uniref:respiratory burst oxidase homolog protein F-like isoform X1 n=1 Tax=Typha angustifolia TaxID=59011 RepID=UPI003C2D948A
MVAFQDGSSSLPSTPTPLPSPKSSDQQHSETLEILIHPQNSSSSISSQSSQDNTPTIEIHVHFQDDHTSSSSPDKLSSPMATTSATPSDEEMEYGKARLLSSHSMKMDFIDCDANGALKWKEMEQKFELPGNSQSIETGTEAMELALRAMGGSNKISHDIYQSLDPDASPKIKISLDFYRRSLHRKIIEKEIKQAILLSASVNMLTLTQEEANECTRLIMEEVGSDQGALETHEDKTSKTSLLMEWSPATPPNHSGGINPPLSSASASTVIFLRAYWRRVWVVLLWLAACAALFGWKFAQYRRRSAFEVMGYCLCAAKGAAETLKLNMALVLLPVCRNTMTWLRKSRRINSVVPFNDTLNFHKLIAAGIVIGVILHGGIHLTCDFPRIAEADEFVFRQTIADDFEHQRPTYFDIIVSTEGTTGIAMVILMAIAFLLATRPSRRNSALLPWPIRKVTGFNAFWYSHHLLILVYVLLIIHSMFLFLAKQVAEKTTWMYIAIPVLIYTGERVFRMIRSEIYDVKILEASVYPGKVLSLKLRKPAGFRYKSGMYVFVQCPQISKFEWHPYSLTSAPDDGNLSMHIRSLGDWSYQTYSLFQEALVSGSPDFPKISIDGPYGAASQDHAKYDFILLIGLGIGATPFISVLRDIANGLQKVDSTKGSSAKGPKKAYFYWVTREQGSFEWFRDIMKEVSILDRKQGVIEMYNYLTSVYQEGDKRSALISAIQALHFMKNGIDIISRTPVRTQFARPNWFRVFSALASRHEGERIGVFYCGPEVLGRQLERLCHKMSSKTPTRFVFHKEHY